MKSATHIRFPLHLSGSEKSWHHEAMGSERTWCQGKPEANLMDERCIDECSDKWRRRFGIGPSYDGLAREDDWK
jgi:hypothetical protein